MKFNLWTFLFQAINFVVLLFILQRLLYKPVREIMEKRREAVRKTVEDAERAKREAQELKEHFEQENGRLQEERTQALDNLQEEMSRRKKDLLEKAAEEAKHVREKETALLEAEKKRFLLRLRDEVIDSVAVYADRIFADIADEDLHRAHLRRFIGKLKVLSPEDAGIEGTDGPVSVQFVSAFDAGDDVRDEIRKVLESALLREIKLASVVDRSLISGALVKINDRIIDASLSGQIVKLKKELQAIR